MVKHPLVEALVTAGQEGSHRFCRPARRPVVVQEPTAVVSAIRDVREERRIDSVARRERRLDDVDSQHHPRAATERRVIDLACVRGVSSR